jgi:hypothetical protein
VTAALSDQLQQTSPGVLVVFVRLQVVNQLIDASTQQRNLNFRRSCVIGMDVIGVNDGLFLFSVERHAALLTDIGQ